MSAPGSLASATGSGEPAGRGLRVGNGHPRQAGELTIACVAKRSRAARRKALTRPEAAEARKESSGRAAGQCAGSWPVHAEHVAEEAEALGWDAVLRVLCELLDEPARRSAL